MKDNFVSVAGEVKSAYYMTGSEIDRIVRDAVAEVGYNYPYFVLWEGECPCSKILTIEKHIGYQSPDISQGVDAGGWGDQGIFWGLAVNDESCCFMPKDYWLARKLANELYMKRVGGIDIKTMVTVDCGVPTKAVIAIPARPCNEQETVDFAMRTARELLGAGCEITVNGTGRYVTHGSVGDCGTTGRKLVVDFYGGNSRIGGGSPWGKDPTKADVTLNILARQMAKEYMMKSGMDEVRCSLSCCIGRKDVTACFYDKNDRIVDSSTSELCVDDTIERLGLRRVSFADMCKDGLFGNAF